MLIGEAFCMWDVASRKVYMELMVSKLEGHGLGFVQAAEKRELIHKRRQDLFLGEILLPDAAADPSSGLSE